MRIRFCGIDISKDNFHTALIDDQGQPLWSRSFPMSSEGFRDFWRALRPRGSSVRSLRLGQGVYLLILALRKNKDCPRSFGRVH